MGLTKPRAYQIYDIDYKQAVRVVTTSNITLSGGAPNSVDGVTLSLNDRVLVTGQSTGSQNGIYYVTTLGTGANGTWARAVDGDATGEILAGMIIMVTEGTSYADTQWKLTTNDPIVIGSTSLTFVLAVQANLISSGSSNVVVNANANVTVSSGGTANVLVVSSTGTVTTGTASVSGNVTGGNIITAGLVSATGNINTVGALNINSTGGNYNVLNISGTALAPYGTPQTWKFFTNNTALGGAASFILFPDSSTQTTAYPGTSSTLSLTANITGGNLLTGGLVSATSTVTGSSHLGTVASLSGNVTGGNILTVGQVSATGTITTASGTNSTGFAVGNGAVSNVGLGFFPTAGTRGDYAIRDYSSVFSTMYLDVGMGSSAGGEFQFRASNAYSLVMRANTTGVYSPGIVSATGIVYGSELNSTNSLANEGGQINLALPSSGSTLSTSVIIDVYQNKVRFFEGGGTARGAYLDLTSCSAGAATNLLAGGGGGTPGGSNTYVQFNDGGAFGGNGQFTYDKVANTLTAGIIAANNNGAGTNFKVGDDAWIGDINVADTMSIRGQQSALNGYIIFGNSDANGKLGRAGTGPITCGTAFSASGNVTGGNILTGGLISAASTVTGTSFIGAVASSTTVSATGNVTGGNILTGGLISATGRTYVASGTAAAPGITFSADTGQDTGFYWVSDGNIGVTTNGTLRFTFLDTGVSATGTITGTSHLGSVVSVSGAITGASVVGGVMTGSSLSVSGGVTAASVSGGVITGSSLSTSGTITGTSHLGSVVSVSGAITGASVVGGVMTGSSLSVSGTVTGASLAGTITTASQTNITAVGTLTSLNSGAISSSGNVTAAGHVGTIYTNSIINTGANATGNIGSSTLYFNTAFIKATSAQYADLAEMYVADNPYQPGTVLEFGGNQEVTITTRSHSTAVAGIVSTNPSYLMNSCLEGEHVVAVALTGRVPCQVLGPVKKGDVLVSSNLPGVAQRIGTDWQPGVVVGKSMGVIDVPEVQIIEVAVGRL